VLIEAGFSAEAAYAETFYELQFFVENLVKERLANSRQGSSTSTYLILSKTGEVVDDHVRDNMRRMLGRIQSGELVREWNLEQMAGAPMLHQRKRALAEHEIKDVEDVFLERKKASGW
jgi:ketol-acid reductoisomerase